VRLPRWPMVLWYAGALVVIAAGVADLMTALSDRTALQWVFAGVVLALGGFSLSAAVAEQRRRRRTGNSAFLPATAARDGIPGDVLELALAGRKIEAIRRYRQLTGARLADAKAAVDSIGRTA
jgi:ribosomal protein L7/L12